MDRYIITKAEIDALEGTQKTHFLNENAKRLNKSLGDLTGLNGVGIHMVEVQPTHALSEKHLHYFEDEAVYILSGQAQVTIGDDVFQVNAGDFIGFRANGLAHAMVNNGSDTLRCLVIGQRLDHEVALYPEKQKKLYINRGHGWDLADVSAIETLSGAVGKK